MRIVQPGQTIGPYRIMEKIGEGGMAAVYRAYHPAMDRNVALKIMPFQFAQNEEFNQRFQREVKVIAGLEHPHILPVYDSGEFEGSPYLVMRYLKAGTLYHRIKAGPMPLDQIDWIFSQVADALGHAHNRNVIHRDVKPSNILIDERGGAFLTDFGIAKLVGDSSKFTATGVITGTPAYMSPEQAHTQNLDARADVYALGVVLYEMVTGRVPFEAETPMAVILKHMQEPLPLPSELNPDLPEAIERVILKALAKDREDRFGSMAEFVTAWKQSYNSVVSTTNTGAQRPLRTAPRTAILPPSEPTRATPLPQAEEDTAKRKLPVGLLVGGAIGLVALLVLVAGGILLSRLGNDDEGEGGIALAGRDGNNAESIFSGSSDTPTTGERIGAVSTDGMWQTWRGANSVYNLSADDTLVYAGGPTGLTLWTAANGSYEHWTMADGLPSNDVRTTYVDEDGALWVGTASGLGRYQDGTWTIYDAQDGIHPYASAITSNENGLLVGTSYGDPARSGIYQFTSSGWQELPSSSEKDESRNIITSLAYVSGYGLWVGTPNGLGWYINDSWQWFTEDDGLPHNYVNSIYVDQNQHLWIATDGGVVLDDQGPDITVFEQVRGWSIWDVGQDSVGRYWLAGGGGIWLFDREQSDWTFFDASAGAIPVWNATSVVQGGDGHMYFGTEDIGVLHYDGDFSVDAVENVPNQMVSVWGLVAPDDRLWFLEQYTDQIDRYDPVADSWDAPPELPCCSSVPLAFDENNRLWLGGYNGLNIVAGDGTETLLTTESGLPSDGGIFALSFGQNGEAWVGTNSGLVRLVDDGVDEVFTVESAGLADNEVCALLVASDGSVWVGLKHGLSQLTPDGEWVHYDVGELFTGSFHGVRVLAEDPAGNIWVGANDGLYRYSNGEWTAFFAPDDIPATGIHALVVDSVGNVWIGTPAGASAFDGQEWFHFTTEDGLAHPYVNAILPLESGDIWFATDGGISRYTP